MRVTFQKAVLDDIRNKNKRDKIVKPALVDTDFYLCFFAAIQPSFLIFRRNGKTGVNFNNECDLLSLCIIHDYYCP